jgi:hypothetical protein
LFVCYEKALSRSCEEGLLKSAFPAWAFLFRNGYRLELEEAKTVAVIRRVAAEEIGREDLAEWLEANSRPIPETGSFRLGEESISRREESFKKGVPHQVALSGTEKRF